jgi:hypothetical protein
MIFNVSRASKALIGRHQTDDWPNDSFNRRFVRDTLTELADEHLIDAKSMFSAIGNNHALLESYSLWLRNKKDFMSAKTWILPGLEEGSILGMGLDIRDDDRALVEWKLKNV